MISIFLIWNVEVAYIVPRNVTIPIPFTYQFVFRMLHFLRCIIVYLRRDDEGVSSLTHKLTTNNSELVFWNTLIIARKIFKFKLYSLQGGYRTQNLYFGKNRSETRVKAVKG